MPHLRLLDALEKNYAAMKTAFPTEGRRQRILRSLHAGWPDASVPVNNATTDINIEGLDQDQYDELLDNDTFGLLIRADFSNEDAWQTFLAKFQESEREMLDTLRSPPGEENATSVAGASGSTSQGQDVEMESAAEKSANGNGGESDDGSEAGDAGIPDSIVMVYNPSSTEERARLTNISNLTALQLFNDADVRPAIPPPPETRTRYNPNNVLINKNGWQEVFSGKNLWIYDAKSAQDECVRVVAQSGDLYGTATGDSWRARVSHISELQFNMACLDMKIDFGGMDRWDPQERSRNLTEATLL